MLPQSEFESPMFASAPAPVAIAALTQDRALIGLLRSTVDPSHDLILVTSEAELTPHLNSRRVSAALLDSMFIEGDLAAMAERLRATWPDLVLVVVGTAEEQSKVAAQITSGVVYRFLHRPVSAPRVRLFVEAALRRHEVENVERTLEQQVPDFSSFESLRSRNTEARSGGRAFPLAIGVGIALAVLAGAWYAFGIGKEARPEPVAQVVSPATSGTEAAGQAAPPAIEPAARDGDDIPPQATPAESTPPPERAAQVETPPAIEPERIAAPPTEPLPSVAPGPVIEEAVALAPSPTPAATAPAPVTREQRIAAQLALAESALQRGELASPAGRNAVELYRGVLDLDPGNSLAKGGLVRVADRLLSAAERALTAGNPSDAKAMADAAERLTPATARGAFIMMQIERENERVALLRKADADVTDKQDKGATYLRLANSRLKSGALIEPSEDNARFYLDAARQTVPDDPALPEIARALQKELLARAGSAASAGNAAETERWLANADGAGAPRSEQAAIRRSLQDVVVGVRAGRMDELARSFTNALSANQLLEPENKSAKAWLRELITTEAGNPVVTAARQNLGLAFLREMRSALRVNDLRSADTWLGEARSIGFAGEEMDAAAAELVATRERIEQQNSVVGAGSLERVTYVEPKHPVTIRDRRIGGWVELEFTVLTDGTTSDIVVTNSSPRKTFDSSAINAIAQWRYKPVKRGGVAVDQRAAVRIRFSEN